jgi:hypothetical protein
VKKKGKTKGDKKTQTEKRGKGKKTLRQKKQNGHTQPKKI